MKRKKKQVEKNKPNNKITILLILILAIIIIDLISYLYFFKTFNLKAFNFKDSKITDVKCKDGTINGECSIEKPFYCYNKELIKKAFTCGCPQGYEVDFQDCRKI